MKLKLLSNIISVIFGNNYSMGSIHKNNSCQNKKFSFNSTCLLVTKFFPLY